MQPRTHGEAVSDREYREIHEFLNEEVDCLDSHDYAAWLALLTDDIRYVAPLRAFYERGRERRIGLDNAYFDETLGSLRIRVAQHAEAVNTVAENPFTFVRRFVTSVRPRTDAVPGQYRVVSNLLVLRTRPTDSVPQLVSGRREDLLRRVDGRLKLAARTVYFDHNVFHTGNLAFFV